MHAVCRRTWAAEHQDGDTASLAGTSTDDPLDDEHSSELRHRLNTRTPEKHLRGLKQVPRLPCAPVPPHVMQQRKSRDSTAQDEPPAAPLSVHAPIGHPTLTQRRPRRWPRAATRR